VIKIVRRRGVWAVRFEMLHMAFGARDSSHRCHLWVAAPAAPGADCEPPVASSGGWAYEAAAEVKRADENDEPADEGARTSDSSTIAGDRPGPARGGLIRIPSMCGD
jgi:hypothetical protein